MVKFIYNFDTDKLDAVLSEADLDANYLRLDTANDPLTGSLEVQKTDAGLNTVKEVLFLDAFTSGTAANGIGGLINMRTQDSDGATILGNSFRWIATDVTPEAYDTKFDFYVSSNGSDSLLLSLEGGVNKVKISDAFYLPNADGTTDQILKTNGSGVLSWTTQSGGVTDHDALNNLNWASAGHTMDATLNMATNDISGIGAATATSFTDGTATLTGGSLTGVTGGIQLDADNAKLYFGAGDDTSLTWDSAKFIIDASAADLAQLADQPTGGTDLAIATTKYVDDNAGGSQTPWTSDIDAAGYDLNNVGDINSKSDEGDFIIKNLDQDNDILLQVNDGGTVRTAIQVHGDSGAVSMPRQSMVNAVSNANQTIVNNTYTKVLFQTEYIDTLGEFSSPTFTAIEAGNYFVSAHVGWYVNIDGRAWLRLSKEGGTDYPVLIRNAAQTGNDGMVVSGLISLAAGETLEVLFKHEEGGDRTLNSGRCILSIAKVA